MASAVKNPTIWDRITDIAHEHLQGVEWSFNGTISMLYRRWQVVAGSVVVGLAVAIVLMFVMPPSYTASTMLQINTRQQQVIKLEDVLGGLSSSDAAINTEMDVLTSRKLAGRVVDKLNLLQNDEFMSNMGFFNNAVSAVKFFIMPLTEERGVDKAKATADHTRAIDALLRHLEVDLRPRSYSITIRYTAHDAELAAKIANTIAQEYLNSQLEDRFEATRMATEWITNRLQELQRNAQASELAVQRFREKHGLTEARGVLLSEQQLSELNSQLILARTQLAEAQAKYEQTKKMQSKGMGIESAVEVLQSELIMNLRQQETVVRGNMSDLASRYGSRHPRMITIRNQLYDLQRKINEEISKIQISLENSVGVAEARVATLEKQLQNLRDKSVMATDAHVQLSELERQANADKTLYESFLNRSKEIAHMDRAQTDARIISVAEKPISAASPDKLILLLAGLFGGMGLGITLMLMLEALDSGFRTTQQIEALLKVPALGLLGELRDVANASFYVVDKPTSAFTEGVRAIRTALQFTEQGKTAKVVVVTSTVPEEGKSTFAMSLAQLSASGGAKVLLVDADMRRPNLARQLGLKPKAGLSDLLEDKARYKDKDLITKLPKSGLFVLPALANTKFAQELLASPRMKELVAGWRKEYDLVVIDSPPVMAVADAMSLSALADAMLYMVRWGITPRTLASHAMKQLQACKAPVAGCVITRVDLEKQQAYGYGDYGYYYGKYKEYYTD